MSDSIGNKSEVIIICSLEDSGVSYEELHSFIVQVFKDRLVQGLNFKVAKSTLEGFEKYLRNNDSHVFVAIDKRTQKLVGTATFIIRSRKGTQYGHHGLWAVSTQGQGIGSRLVMKEIEYAKSRGIRYVESDTAEGADSSVRAHLKSGFKKAGYYSFPFTNYYSVYFRQFCGESRGERLLLHYFIFPIRYFVYYVYTKTTKNSNGSDTRIIRWLKRVFCYV